MLFKLDYFFLWSANIEHCRNWFLMWKPLCSSGKCHFSLHTLWKGEPRHFYFVRFLVIFYSSLGIRLPVLNKCRPLSSFFKFLTPFCIRKKPSLNFLCVFRWMFRLIWADLRILFQLNFFINYSVVLPVSSWELIHISIKFSTRLNFEPISSMWMVLRIYLFPVMHWFFAFYFSVYG